MSSLCKLLTAGIVAVGVIAAFLVPTYHSEASCVTDECTMVVVWRSPNGDWVKEYDVSSALTLRSTTPSGGTVMEATEDTVRSRLRGNCYGNQCPGTVALTNCSAAGGTTGAWGSPVTRYNCVPDS
jgi:hypothetical protein